MDTPIDLTVFKPKEKGSGTGQPLLLEAVQAGFPSPAEDYIERSLDLNEHLVRHPAATFFVRAQGDSMTEAGILSGDILVVDRALDPSDGRIVIAVLDGELTVKRFRRLGGKVCLEAASRTFRKPIEFDDESELTIWGVVTHTIHEAR